MCSRDLRDASRGIKLENQLQVLSAKRAMFLSANVLGLIAWQAELTLSIHTVNKLAKNSKNAGNLLELARETKSVISPKQMAVCPVPYNNLSI